MWSPHTVHVTNIHFNCADCREWEVAVTQSVDQIWKDS